MKTPELSLRNWIFKISMSRIYGAAAHFTKRITHRSYTTEKRFSFHCFGACARNYDILDVFIYKGMTYLQACQKLFELAGIRYSFGELSSHQASVQVSERSTDWR